MALVTESFLRPTSEPFFGTALAGSCNPVFLEGGLLDAEERPPILRDPYPIRSPHRANFGPFVTNPLKLRTT